MKRKEQKDRGKIEEWESQKERRNCNSRKCGCLVGKDIWGKPKVGLQLYGTECKDVRSLDLLKTNKYV